jgi:hypothetical protein
MHSKCQYREDPPEFPAADTATRKAHTGVRRWQGTPVTLFRELSQVLWHYWSFSTTGQVACSGVLARLHAIQLSSVAHLAQRATPCMASGTKSQAWFVAAVTANLLQSHAGHA